MSVPRGFRSEITSDSVDLIQEPLAVLSADNPWLHRDQLPGKRRGAAKIYKPGAAVMDVEALQRLPLPPLQSNCVLWFWRLSNMLPEALRVLDTWGHAPDCLKHYSIRGRVPESASRCSCGQGFTVMTELRWRKIRQRGKRHFGMGRYIRATSEVAMLAVRGRVSPSIKSLVDELDGEGIDFDGRMPTDERSKLMHSAKPEEFYKLVEAFGPGPYGEIFARVRRPGWWQIGNELEGADQ